MARRSADSLLTARPTTPPTSSLTAALPTPSPPTRRNLLVTTPTPRRRVAMPRPTPQTTTPTSGRQLKVVRLPHPLSNFWPNGVMMTASQKLAIQLQSFTPNLREYQQNVLP